MTLTTGDLDALDPDRHDLGVPALLARRLAGSYEVDEWGFDRDLTVVLSPLAGLRWSATVDGVGQLPEHGGALIVHNARFGPAEPIAVAAALARSTSRPVRFTGVPDRAPIGPLLRRLGGVPSDLADLRSLLASGALVTVPLARDWRRPGRAGRATASALAVAVDRGVPIVPMAVTGFEPSRRRHLVLGAPIVTRRPLAPAPGADLGATVQARVQALLDSGDADALSGDARRGR